MSESGHEYESGDMREWGVYNSGHDMRAAVTQVPSLLWPHHTLLQPGVSGSCETMVWTGAALQWWPQAAAVTSSEWSVPGLWPVMERMGGSGHLVCEHVVQSAAVSASANMILTMMQWLQWLIITALVLGISSCCCGVCLLWITNYHRKIPCKLYNCNQLLKIVLKLQWSCG